MKIKIMYVVTSCRKCGPIQQTLNNIRYLDRTIFEPYLVTIYNEIDESSQLELFLPYVKHYFVKTSKINILVGTTGALKNLIDEISPDIIHSLGVFPDYAVSKIGTHRQVMTLRNYVWDDYPKRLGLFKGTILCLMQLHAAKKATKAIVCSKSLSLIYKEKLKIEFDYIQNGVDTIKYNTCDSDTKKRLRRELNLPEDAVVFVYAAPIVKRKNQVFLINTFLQFEKSCGGKNVKLLLLGDGEEYETVKGKYGKENSIELRGNVLNIWQYYNAADVYVSTSKSEGLPNSVLEAMASGLPVILSDIPQHAEIVSIQKEAGYLYKSDDAEDLLQKLSNALTYFDEKTAECARKAVLENLSAERTSQKYQELYKSIII